MKNQTFVITSLQAWDIPIGSNIKDIALEIAKDNKVLFISTPSEKIEKSRLNEVVKDRLWVFEPCTKKLPIGKLPDGFIFDFVNRINQKRVFGEVLKQIERLNFVNYNLIIDNDIYHSFYANEYLKPSFSIYYRRDNVTGEYWDKHIHRLEPLLAAKCDCVMANIQILADKLKDTCNLRFDVGQGVDLGVYRLESVQQPRDMVDIPRPIVGYTGTIVSDRLDADLIYDIAEHLPSISFAFIGPEDAEFSSHKLHQLSNVHFLGARPVHTMPDYIHSFDVCINPQWVNPLTIGNYPRKIDEYLAMGKPTVATKTDAMEMFKDHVELCENLPQWIDAIKRSAYTHEDKDQIQQRIDFAHTHSWTNCVKKIYRYMEEVKNKGI